MDAGISVRPDRIFSITIILLFLAFATAITPGCISGHSDNTVWTDAPDVDVSTDGTVTYIDLEGGFYGIVAKEGTKYYPLNLGENMKTDGLKVRFLAETKDDIMTVQQWGIPIEIINIKEI